MDLAEQDWPATVIVVPVARDHAAACRPQRLADSIDVRHDLAGCLYFGGFYQGTDAA